MFTYGSFNFWLCLGHSLVATWCWSCITWPSWKGWFCVCKFFMFTCYFLLVVMVLLVVTPKLSAKLSMYVVYLFITCCWLFTKCLRGKVRFWDLRNVVCMFSTCYKQTCLLVVRWMNMWLLEICLSCICLVGLKKCKMLTITFVGSCKNWFNFVNYAFVVHTIYDVLRSLLDSNVSMWWKHRKSKKLGHAPWLAALWG